MFSLSRMKRLVGGFWYAARVHAGYPPRIAVPMRHTRVQMIAGIAHTQVFGPEHIVPGSEHVVEVPGDVHVFTIRHTALI